MQFQVQIPANLKDPLAILKALNDALNQVGLVFQENESLKLVELHAPPQYVEHGRFYFADGTDWDPGSGRGVYVYDSTGPTWRLLG